MHMYITLIWVLLKLDELSQNGDLKVLMVWSAVRQISSENLSNFECIDYKLHSDFQNRFQVKKVQLIHGHI